MQGAAQAGGGGGSFDELDRVLRRLIEEHEGLLVLAQEHRRAIAAADVTAMQACLGQQAAALARVQQLEVRRRQVSSGLVTGPAPAQVLLGTPTVTTIADRAGEPVRTRLRGLGDRLREVLNRLHGEHAAVREAAETLSAHMEGVMRQVCRRLSHAGTYGPGASIDTRTAVVTSLDVRT